LVEQFINYLCHNPSDTTSPLYLELNTSSMLYAQFGNSSTSDRVTIYDANAQIANTPYVKLSDQGQRQRMATFTNGGSYWEKQTLTCECVALGATASSAVDRAELLKLAVEGLIKKTRVNIASLPTRTDLGGTGSNESIGNLQIGQIDREMPVMGQNPKFTASRMALIEVWVYKERKL
jgi:hypothetical protein